MLFSVLRKFPNTPKLQNYIIPKAFNQTWGPFGLPLSEKVVFNVQIVSSKMPFFSNKYVSL